METGAHPTRFVPSATRRENLYPSTISTFLLLNFCASSSAGTSFCLNFFLKDTQRTRRYIVSRVRGSCDTGGASYGHRKSPKLALFCGAPIPEKLEGVSFFPFFFCVFLSLSFFLFFFSILQHRTRQNPNPLCKTALTRRTTLISCHTQSPYPTR